MLQKTNLLPPTSSFSTSTNQTHNKTPLTIKEERGKGYEWNLITIHIE